MIDLKQLRDDPERVRASQRARGDDPALVDALLAAGGRYADLWQAMEDGTVDR